MERISREALLRSGLAWIAGIATIKVLFHFLTNGNYGYFRDEYYYIACSERLAWGYVDQPPLSILLLSLARQIMGDSIFAIRFFAVAAEAGVVVLAGLTARVMGGGTFAQVLASVVTLMTPVFLAISTFYSMNALEHLFWALAVYVLVLLVRRDNPKLWLVFGLVAGLGLQTKISMLFLGFGVAVGLVLTPERKHLKSRYLWLGGASAFAIFLPYIAWQFMNGAPTLEFTRNAAMFKNIARAPLAFLADVALMAHPLYAIILVVGLLYLLFSRQAAPYRILGWSFSAILVVFLVQRGAKSYYVAPAFPMLIAPGAVALERFFSAPRLIWFRPLVVLLILAGGCLTLPMTTPMLPIERFVAYQRWLGITAPQEEAGHTGEIPQLFSDRFGWEEMTEAVAEVYRALPADDQARCGVFTRNYGEAGALEFHGKDYGLPPVLSGHNNYWLWGYGDITGDVIITVGIPKEDLEGGYESVEWVATHTHRYAVPEEQNVPICVCRGRKQPMEQVWPRVKIFI